MKFYILYAIALVRGLFRDKYKYQVIVYRYPIKRIKQLYKSGFTPYYVTSEWNGFRIKR